MRLPLLSCLTAGLVAALTALPAHAQIDRRDRQDPEIVIDSGGRTGACDVLTFTKDGKQLLAVGDDKVVRTWDLVDGKLRPAERPVLRWGIWREGKGSIYALALSPNEQHVVIGGFGMLDTTVTVLDRKTGDIVHTTTVEIKDNKNFYAVWAVDYAPSGNKVAFGTGDGSVFVWDFKKEPMWCGRHNPKAGDYNIAKFVAFLDENTLLSVAEDGTMKEWDVRGSKAKATERPAFTTEKKIDTVSLSPDKKWLAASTRGHLVVLCTVEGKQHRDFSLANDESPAGICFDPRDKNRLVVSVSSYVDQPNRKADQRFKIDADFAIRIYDLSGQKPTVATTLPHTYRAEAVTFHPTENYLAIAGGENQEVTLWNLDKPEKPTDVIRGAGSGLWSVALSLDDKQFAFQDHRNAAANDPNKRGGGAWRVFDLPKRGWRKADGFKAVPQLDKANGWSIRPGKDVYQWFAVAPGGEAFPLPRNGDAEGIPYCYTFIEAKGTTPTRVAVGHYWGFSLYELNAKTGPKRTRVFAGHQGEVMALAVSADQSWIVSVANDQTVAAWNLGDVFPSHPILGAKFSLNDGRLLVDAVDVGSPAWEAGLVEKDEVELLRIDNKDVPKDQWFARLENPEPNHELYFKIRRGGPKEALIPLKTLVKHRPLWRFFPTRDGEWAMWMWRSSYYDCSTKGDSSIGWHVNNVEMNGKPAYHPAERFRTILNKPAVLDKLLLTRDVKQALREASDNNNFKPLSFAEFEPNPVTINNLPAAPVKEEKVTFTVVTSAISANPDYQPKRAELWINDHRLSEWTDMKDWQHNGNRYSLDVTVPNENLRAGDNVITLQSYNLLGGRADFSAKVKCTRMPSKPRLFGLAVGVNDYSAIKGAGGTRGKLGDLYGVKNDAQEFRDRWQQDALYDGKTDMIVGLDGTAKRGDIIKALDDLAKKVGPEDNCVILLAGHGLFVRNKTDKGESERSAFVYCCHDFDLAKQLDSGITNEDLYAKLAAIQGHKVVILDACHSGEAGLNPARSLTPGGQGPVILAACDRHQFSYEFPKYNPELDRPTFVGGGAAAVGAVGVKEMPRHGLFTFAILEVLGDKKKFTAADTNHDGQLDAGEIYNYTLRRMPDLLNSIGIDDSLQRPVIFKPPAKEMVGLAEMKEK